ncbi:rRNA biogenesis protein rrp36 [Penicillium malachiteum]|uniref:rRNA biogenesis protein RRP36 n=1 Tax=Penicillium malachiteum TaxID=1324776 RepID=A0AAD6HJI8_9EURO|nr:rRNA biogenesis protein rrp36 [Penicillium malachiteum]
MAISDMLNRRVRARPTDDEIYSDDSDVSEEPIQRGGAEDDESDEDLQSQDDEDVSESGSEGEGEGEDEDEDEDSQDEDLDEEDSDDQEDDQEDFKASLNNISFGALAKAQASMGPKKRKSTKATEESTSTASPLDDIRARIREAREQKREAAGLGSSAKDKQDKKEKARSSKHAPMVQSSKRAVTRKRIIVEPPAVAKARDPRFDAAVMGHSGAGKFSEGASKAYSFLDDYRASELKDLKEQFAKTKNLQHKEELKKQIRSATDKMKTAENKKREREIIADHKKREKQMLREGKKSTPYFLKKSDLKQQVLEKKYEGMKSKERAKALERRRKKMASKERKDMPWERRGTGMGDDEPPSYGGGGKRRRLD